MIGTFAILSFRMIPSFTRITVSFQQFSFYRKSAEIIFNELEKEVSKRNENSSFNKESNIIFDSKVTFNKIIYQYQKSEFILSVPHFEILKNNYIGIKGKSGSGKTTFINLLSGLVSPSEGKIEIDGIELNKSNKNNWYKKLVFFLKK